MALCYVSVPITGITVGISYVLSFLELSCCVFITLLYIFSTWWQNLLPRDSWAASGYGADVEHWQSRTLPPLNILFIRLVFQTRPSSYGSWPETRPTTAFLRSVCTVTLTSSRTWFCQVTETTLCPALGIRPFVCGILLLARPHVVSKTIPRCDRITYYC